MVLGFDPFRDVDRLVDQMFSGVAGVARGVPMDLYQSGDHYVLHCDLPAVDPGSIDVNVDGSLLTITAQRSGRPDEGVRWLVRERPTGTFTRRISLGDGLDSSRISATWAEGVLTLTIPIAESAKPRRIDVTRVDEPAAATAGKQAKAIAGTAT